MSTALMDKHNLNDSSPSRHGWSARTSSKPLLAIVGADGFVGGGLSKRLAAEPSLRTASIVYGGATEQELRISRAAPLLADADIILNCGGFRVRPGCSYRDYQNSHQGSTAAFVPYIRKDALLIQISSASVLGKGHGLGNQSAPNPMTFPSPEYALAKLEQEQYLESVSLERGFRVIFLRPAVLYSADGAGMVSTIIGLTRRGISPRLYPRSCRQHLAHMDLLADVVRRVIRRDDLPNLTRLVVADPYTVTNHELEEIIRSYQKMAGLPLPLPAHWMSRILCSTFGSGKSWLDFKTRGQILGVVAADIVYDPSDTYRLLEIDSSRYTIDQTLLRVIMEALKQ